jgi:hypothetical protein
MYVSKTREEQLSFCIDTENIQAMQLLKFDCGGSAYGQEVGSMTNSHYLCAQIIEDHLM